MAAKMQRVVDIKFVNSGLDVQSIVYNPASGAEKVLPVGPRLIPIQVSGGWTTNVSAGVIIPYLGANIAVYNNSGTAGAVTISPATTTAQVIGGVDANGNVGVACPANAWTYLSMGYNQYIISTAATLITYIIEDPTSMIQQTPPLIPQNVPGFDPAVNS